ncbi:MAG: hypothetical protein WCI73_05650 [Phycisphaerae bacterium]
MKKTEDSIQTLPCQRGLVIGIGGKEIKEAYEQHRRLPYTAPLHVVKDEMSERYPDLFPPQSITNKSCRPAPATEGTET